MRNKNIVAANWKMNGNKEEVINFSNALSTISTEHTDVYFAPSSLFLSDAAEVKQSRKANWKLTAQCSHYEDSGAFTGAHSMKMIKEIGCDAVLIGHSERRQYQGESDKDCFSQVCSALKNNLTPILCIGESELQKEKGKTEEILNKQLTLILSQLSDESLLKTIIAYEPIWAIGTGKTASAEDVEKIHQIIRSQVAEKHAKISTLISVIYGGSVKVENSKKLFSQQNINGGLIGGASLKIEDFKSIIDISDNLKQTRI